MDSGTSQPQRAKSNANSLVPGTNCADILLGFAFGMRYLFVPHHSLDQWELCNLCRARRERS
eukprot:3443698-Rhodomonas_salina.2